jgi:hypothetical protein
MQDCVSACVALLAITCLMVLPHVLGGEINEPITLEDATSEPSAGPDSTQQAQQEQTPARSGPKAPKRPRKDYTMEDKQKIIAYHEKYQTLSQVKLAEKAPDIIGYNISRQDSM